MSERKNTKADTERTNGDALMKKEAKKTTAPQLKVVGEAVGETTGEATKPIAKPSKFNLNKFKSKQTTSVAGGVETLQNALPHGNLAGAKDFVRLHPNEDEYWS